MAMKAAKAKAMKAMKMKAKTKAQKAKDAKEKMKADEKMGAEYLSAKEAENNASWAHAQAEINEKNKKLDVRRSHEDVLVAWYKMTPKMQAKMNQASISG
jgi:hypothetical protein